MSLLTDSLSLQLTAFKFRLDERDDGDAIQAALLELTGQRTVPNVFISACLYIPLT